MRVTDAEGKSLSRPLPPTGEFASINLRVAYADARPWARSSLDDAAFALREMPRYCQRLLAGYDRDQRRFMGMKDADVRERAGDLAEYLWRTWYAGVRRDKFEILAEIVEHTLSHQLSAPRCPAGN